MKHTIKFSLLLLVMLVFATSVFSDIYVNEKAISFQTQYSEKQISTYDDILYITQSGVVI